MWIQGSRALVINCSPLSIDVHVGEVGVKNDDDIKDQSKLINEGVCKKKMGEERFCKLKQTHDNYN